MPLCSMSALGEARTAEEYEREKDRKKAARKERERKRREPQKIVRLKNLPVEERREVQRLATKYSWKVKRVNRKWNSMK